MSMNKRSEIRQMMPEPRILIQGKIEGFLEDLSNRGAGLILNSQYETGEELSFTIDFGKWLFFKSVRVTKARVIWSLPKHSQELSKIGIEFEEIPEDDEKHLKDYLTFWEQDESKMMAHIEKLEKIMEHAGKLSIHELQRILAQFSFFRVIPLSSKIADLIKNINISRKLIRTFEKISVLSTDELKDLDETIKAFEKSSVLTHDEMQSREEVIEAYEKLQEYMRQELAEKDRMLESAQHILQMANQEKLEKDKTIQALEQIGELMRGEQMEKDSIIKAHEQLQEIYRKEMIEKENLIFAFEELQKLHNRETQEKDQILEMHQILEDLARREILEKDKEIQVRDMLTELAREEILQREKVIAAYDQFTSVVQQEILYKDQIIEKIQKTKDIKP